MSKNDKKDDRIVALLQLASELSAEEKNKLAGMGCVIPNIGASGEITVKYAYRCPQCNNAALYFIGEKFNDTMGNEMDTPPLATPIDHIPWKQDLPLTKINRAHPQCQHCGTGIALTGRSLIKRFIIQWSAWIASRTEADKQLAQARMRRATQSLTELAAASSGGSIPTDPYTATLKTGKLSKHVRLSDDARRDIEALEQAGLTGPLERM